MTRLSARGREAIVRGVAERRPEQVLHRGGTGGNVICILSQVVTPERAAWLGRLPVAWSHPSFPPQDCAVCAGLVWPASSVASAAFQLRLPSWPQKVGLSSSTM